MDTIVIFSTTSCPIIVLSFTRTGQVVLDTANGTKKFPHVDIMMTMTDEMKRCNPKPLQILAEWNQTKPPTKQRPSPAKLITNSANAITVAVLPLPQFDKTAKIIVKPALATATDKHIHLRMSRTTDFPYTMKSQTKKPGLHNRAQNKDVRSTQPPLKYFNTHINVMDLMKAGGGNRNEKDFWFPHQNTRATKTNTRLYSDAYSRK